MLDSWVEMALDFAGQPAEFYSGARKIIRARNYSFDNLGDELKIEDCGFTRSKMTMLHRLYRHEESIEVAKRLWEGRIKRDKYGSVGFTTYNHFVKTDEGKGSKRASVMGPCIQSVTLTLLNGRTTAVDCFYRTTELFKKFPADLVFLRDDLLAGFDLTTAPVSRVTFHFANITCHPMYFVTLLPSIDDPIRALDRLERLDPYFYSWVIKWTARYLCDEHSRGILKFAQALRVRKDALERIEPRQLKKLQEYMRENHPGYRKDYVDPDDEGEGE